MSVQSQLVADKVERTESRSSAIAAVRRLVQCNVPITRCKPYDMSMPWQVRLQGAKQSLLDDDYWSALKGQEEMLGCAIDQVRHSGRINRTTDKPVDKPRSLACHEDRGHRRTCEQILCISTNREQL
jgi:hypothetical protein